MKGFMFLTMLLGFAPSYAADLMTVFQDAVMHDPQYQRAIIKTRSAHEDVAISRSFLLPGAELSSNTFVDAQNNYGAITQQNLYPNSNTYKSLDLKLQLSQPIFNYAYYKRFKAAKLSSREAAARLNSQMQDLMIRVVKAYLQVLRAENQLTYYKAYKKALRRQLYDVKEKYSVGKTTKTDVEMALSAYSSVMADYVAAEERVFSSRDFLETITATDYPNLSALGTKLPAVSPKPARKDLWVQRALQQNWLVKANQLKIQIARENIKRHFADHLPVVSAQAYVDQEQFHMNHGSTLIAPGSSRELNSLVGLGIKLPLYSGGLVTAQTRKAKYEYQQALLGFDASVRETRYLVRRSYLRIIASLKKMQQGQLAIQAAASSLEGLRERYQAGKSNLTDVLNEQEQLVNAQIQYDSYRYDYIIELLNLKKATGILAVNDLQKINDWLV